MVISLVALLAKGLWWGIGTAIYYVLYQQIENHLLGPLVLGPPGTVAGVMEDADVDELVGTAALAVLAAGTDAT